MAKLSIQFSFQLSFLSAYPVFHDEENDADEGDGNGEHRCQLHHKKPVCPNMSNKYVEK